MTEQKDHGQIGEPSMREKFAQANEHRDYSIYTKLMDAALEAKSRAIFPHFGQLPEGAAIVDIGSGTGAQAELAAREFRSARVYALDYSHELLEQAVGEKTFVRPVFGNAVERNFPDNSLDAAYASTSGHEIESFGGPGSAEKTVQIMFSQLKPGGKLVWRDFAKPSLTEPVYMKINSTVGLETPPPNTPPEEIDYNSLSPQAIFECFHRQFGGGGAFEYERVTVAGQEYLKISPEWAHEFYLHKDYTANFLQEVKEKYTYWTPEEARQVFEAAGFVNVRVIPEQNEWITKNRLKGKIELAVMDEEGKLQAVDFPPTHMVIVGEKPKDYSVVSEGGEIEVVDYEKILATIDYNPAAGLVRIGEKEFAVEDQPIVGGKKICFWLKDQPGQVLKIVRPDARNVHNAFKSVFQTVERQQFLEENEIPRLRILKTDPEGPPYRYVIQEAAPQGVVSADELIRGGELSERDIQQMSAIVNRYEKGRQWQLDTNPFSWFRVTKDDGQTEMVYASGKVYRFDEDWTFEKIGLLQWLDPKYVSEATASTAAIPQAKAHQALVRKWAGSAKNTVFWKKYLDPTVQPKEG
ncbi:MAG: hypothetical protein UX09_C0027G0006 [Candidatus Uhrbacteria bacterium GW2011_GWE2_45_35]|uniref:Methyltransferase type 11 domain-containing protein n=2 Tax=Candidatus Uhriibacteriota TaxID=1752732 RepID=A0A0G1JIY1_9BACT|nr:MAG: hypothetical protein UW63_C0019G0008 [Candidatus Uhrbacteria bacterium GW2011_GWF2_44_350]KKU07590.1 MAG: hypothetical protein UX09_C0027G0006 [Candidatus Uhrbacteria bacterium GW2011_GWE2_45_35]HBR80237.1 hypothetical protein [Candidatus Uhrbacteria bacterium]HCU31952.1 hypothetical protein [Candidatus Uhrbacteria bacterium]